MKLLKGMGVALALALLATSGATAQDDKKEPIKVGILHSLSGTMAISEMSLRDVTPDGDRRDQRQGRRACGKQDRAGRRRSRVQLAALRREGQAADRAGQGRGDFGCWTSVSRKSVLPVFEKNNGLLFYPVQYEGEERSQQRLLHRRGRQPAGSSPRPIT